ncbi:helix-turn-helix domain-containing protein [Domibacillus mangrovi]|uniref:Resolvase HTH domain-containing protein n=1 Tax=Domibacillus mangrovi TaxID=1714354 RepID=A0A1Q5P7D1_9BACI|nr:helix-turn-helix domain-containing protein [Domibacillus mangrovi]OKL38114.1 hypothetical protein BLL40_01445 [Domibacillus mangrovi]
MNGLLIGLAAAGTAFIVLSFFLKDRQQQLEKDLEELSLQMLQEHYQINKKIRLIEEELLISDDLSPSIKKPGPINQIIQNQVIALYNQGVDIPQIAGQSSLSVKQVKRILANPKLHRKDTDI